MLQGRSQAASLNFNSSSNLILGYRFDQILLEHLSPINPAQSVAYDPNFQYVNANDQGQNCYSYMQTVLPLYNTLALPASNTAAFPALAHAAGENVFLVYYIETPANNVNSPGILHYLYRKIHYGSSLNLNLNQADFQSYTPTTALVNAKPGT